MNKVKNSQITKAQSGAQPQTRKLQAALLRERLADVLPRGPALSDSQLLYRPEAYLDLPNKPPLGPSTFNYLTTLDDDEREIVRISLDSTLGDVMRIWARTVPPRVKYFADDEYSDESGLGILEHDGAEDDESGETKSRLEIEDSETPLVFGRLILMIARCIWPSISDLCDDSDHGLWGTLFDPSFRKRHGPDFISISSSYYRGLAKYFETEASNWYSDYYDKRRSQEEAEDKLRESQWEAFLSDTGFPPRAPRFYAGDRLRHPHFGEGVVMSCTRIEGDYAIEVEFNGCTGTKKLVEGTEDLELVEGYRGSGRSYRSLAHSRTLRVEFEKWLGNQEANNEGCSK